MSRFVKRSEIGAPAEEVFAWHARPGAIDRLTPPWEPLVIEQPPDSLEIGTRVVFRSTIPGPVAVRMVAEHVGYDPPREFRDAQVSGPFASWEHRHRFESVGPGRTILSDEVTYSLPALGEVLAGRVVRRRLRRMFDYRHRQTIEDLAAHSRARERGNGIMHVAVTGSSGVIGSALVAFLGGGGHRVTRLVRRAPSGPDELAWDPAAGKVDAEGLRGVDAVVNLAGEPIGGGRWTDERKRRIRDSRVDGTRLLAETLAGMDDGPRILVQGSAIGFYGHDRGNEILTEETDSGSGFLAGVVREWEAAADPARKAGLRVVAVRTGIVQSPRGGALKLQLPLFQLGAGGKLGSGRQWVSWITIDDIVGVFHHALTTSDLEGVINGTAPEPVTNAEYTRVLGHVLGRPTLLPVPKLGPTVLLGKEGAVQTALASQRVLPARTEATGYVFRHRDLEAGLRHVLGRVT